MLFVLRVGVWLNLLRSMRSFVMKFFSPVSFMISILVRMRMLSILILMGLKALLLISSHMLFILKVLIASLLISSERLSLII